MRRLLHINCDDTHLWKCAGALELAIGEGDACVVEADKVQEFGRVARIVGEIEDEAARILPAVLRRATLQDQSRASENLLFSRTAFKRCQEKIDEFKLAMRLMRVRYAFDRSKLMVTFTAEERVDFRQLVQDLAAETRTRVEMRQIGVRDAAAIYGGFAPCGQRLCCSVWLKEFDNIHIRMAKLQGLSLSPAVVNGMCGRLKCCLRFEHNCYRDLSGGLPHEGEKIKCPCGPGQVLESRVLAQRVKVRLDDQRVLEFAAGEVKRLGN